MENKDKIPIIISILALVISVVSGYETYLNSKALYDFEVTRTRADISILINPQFSQNWTFVSDGVYFTVNGTLKNEGSRAALLKRIDLTVTYHFSDGNPYALMVGYFDLPKWCKLDNTTISEKEAKAFSITVFIHSSIAVNTNDGQILGIGVSKSDNFTLSITYNDGINDLRNEKEFDTNE